MNEKIEEHSDRVHRVSNKWIVTISLAIITAVTTIGSAYYSNRPDVSDRWYGRDGRANRDAIKSNSDRIKQLEQLMVTTNLRLQGIEHIDSSCRENVTSIRTWIDEHERKSDILINEFKVGIQQNRDRQAYLEKLFNFYTNPGASQ